ncbi:MAG: CCA tRNA nucleotidyltransferase [Dehalococcoidales bacterium]|nr:CCA tRNA nucleotidyltransferase [Dehalococcoidales bacterium]
MGRTTNLGSRIKTQLPAEMVNLIQTAGSIAARQGDSLYLVGGVVRDLLLEKANLDLDLVVEGNAIRLAESLAGTGPARLTTHPHFNTAKLEWGKWSIDFATARSESYAKAGALPTIAPSSIEKDLFRRDFTINAMAVCLSPERYGELIDRYGGQYDLENKLIRILHEKSFVDDATRIWRGLRYEQRLGFRMEEDTLRLLKRDIPMLDTISGDRIRYELECVFQEEEPEKVLSRAEELGILVRLHPEIKGNSWLYDRFQAARKQTAPDPPSFSLYLALLVYRLDEESSEQFISYLRLPGSIAQVIRDTIALKSKLRTLAYPEIKRSKVYHIIRGHTQSAITANLLAVGSPIARQHLEIFLHELRYVKPTLSGHDLIEMGFSPSPRIKEVLKLLHDARLDERASSKADEEKLAREWLGEEHPE